MYEEKITTPAPSVKRSLHESKPLLGARGINSILLCMYAYAFACVICRNCPPPPTRFGRLSRGCN